MQPARVSAPPMDIKNIYELVEDDLKAVNTLIRKRLSSDVVLINQLGHYIINSGGKRLRPILVLLSAGACGYKGEQHLDLAAVIEFIHTATLLHDDVVDESDLRRGRQTANSLWGSAASVLVGDFLYSRSFQMMVEARDMRVMEILADATNIIAEGEVMQLLNCHDPDTTEARYLEVIRCKTAKLFEAAARLGAVLSNLPRQEEECLARYGSHLGTAFQIVDDALDYTASSAEIGKNIGDDLSEGKPTLPIIYAMQYGTAEQRALLRKTIEDGGLDSIDAVIEAIESTSAIEYTLESAKQEADKAIEALQVLPPSIYTEALYSLAKFAVERKH